MRAYKPLLLAVALLAPLWALAAQQKYALVIGNNDYPASIGPLRNPVADATAVSNKLRALGYRVDLKTNLNLQQMSEAVDQYRRRLSANTANEGFFWYAGHGVQIDGLNYLVPLNADPASRSSLKFSSYPADQLLATLEEAGNTVNVVVLDACRNTPQLAATRGTRGLAVIVSTPADIIVMYSTAQGQVAQDGEGGRNSPFTEAFLRHIDKAEPLTLVLQDISADVYRSTDNSQSPWIGGTFRTNPRYSIVRAAPAAQPAPAPQPAPAAPAPQPTTAPQAPLNVRAGTPGTDSVTLSWDSAGSGISYKVYYSNRNDPSGAEPLGNLTAGTSMNVNSMASGTAYYFWVASVRDGLESAKSPMVTVLTAAVPPQPAPAAATVQPAAVPVNPLPDNFVRINGGTFTMGNPAGEVNRDNDEVQHRVTVGSFYMGKYEVTQREWAALMGSNPSEWKGDNLPVENVSWYDAIDYCNRRSRREGLTPAYTRNGDTVTWNRNANGYRLPTEAEWEYACRAGTSGPFSTGNNITTSQANYDGNHPYNGNAKGQYRERTWNVGSGTANAWDLYDMHGNVWEWCWDWYGTYPSGAQTDPAGAASGSRRVLRGGSWDGSAQSLRSAARNFFAPSLRDSHFGFRLVRP